MRHIIATVVLVAMVASSSMMTAEGAKKRKGPAPQAKKSDAPPSNSGVPRQVKEDDTSRIPDPQNNERDRKYLQCTACQTAVEEIGKRFENVHQEFQYEPEKIKGYHIASAVDEMCHTEGLHYGMLRDPRTKIVHPKYIDERTEDKNGAKPSVIKGGWATKLWITHCEELMERVDDDIIDLFHGKKLELCPFCKPLYEAEEKQRKELEAKKAKEEESKPKNGDNDKAQEEPKKEEEARTDL